MVEHVSLGLRFRLMRGQQNFDSIYAEEYVEEFVRNFHAKVEDEVVFLILTILSSQGEQQVVTDVLRRLEADHKLIDTIGGIT